MINIETFTRIHTRVITPKDRSKKEMRECFKSIVNVDNENILSALEKPNSTEERLANRSLTPLNFILFNTQQIPSQNTGPIKKS